MRNSIRALFTLMFVFLMASASIASGLLLAGNSVPGMTIEKYNEDTHVWQVVGSAFPCQLTTRQYEYVQIRISASGYEDFNAGYDVRWTGNQKYNIELESTNPNPNSQPLFAVDGTVTSKSGKDVTQFIVWTRNLTAINKGQTGQAAEDDNPVQPGGWYTTTLGGFSAGQGVAVGDRLFVGVFTSDKLRSLGYKVIKVTQDHMDNDQMTVNLIIK